MSSEEFRPSIHGFAFTNSFGAGRGEPGLGVPVHPSLGLGAGMVWAALDRYLAGRAMEDALTPPAPASRLHAELVERQASAFAAGVWSRLVAWQCLRDDGAAGLAGRTRKEWAGIRAQLDRGVPVMLLLIMARGRHANPTLNRPVLAYGYEREAGSSRILLRVYDPDRPKNDGVRLVFQAARRGTLDARLAVQTEVRGFFAVPYDRPLPALLEAGRADLAGLRVERLLGVEPKAHGAGASLLARSQDGTLVRVRRARAGKWTAEPLDGGRRGARIAEDPCAVSVSGDRMFVRAADGALIECARSPGIGWRMRDLTNRRGIGDAFRIDGLPAPSVGRRTGTSVIAYAGGRIVRYHKSAVGGWHAEELMFGPLRQMTFEGAPAAHEDRAGTLHVLARSTGGELMHLRLGPKTGWVSENASSRAGARDHFRFAGDFLLRTGGRNDRLDAVGLTATGDVLLLRWTELRSWRGLDLSAQVRAGGVELPPIAGEFSADVDGDGTLHVVGRDARGGLVHAWCGADDAVGGDAVTFTRERIGDAGRLDGVPRIVAGPGPLLHVLGRQDDELLLYRWTPLADWCVENLTRERRASGALNIAGDPVVSADGRVAFVQPDGRLSWITLEAAERTAGVPLGAVQAGAVVRVPLSLVTGAIGAVADAIAGAFTGGRGRAPGPEPAAPIAAPARTAPTRAATAPAVVDPSLPPPLTGAPDVFGAGLPDEPAGADVGQTGPEAAEPSLIVDWTPAAMFGGAPEPPEAAPAPDAGDDPWAVAPARTLDAADGATPTEESTFPFEEPAAVPAVEPAAAAPPETAAAPSAAAPAPASTPPASTPPASTPPAAAEPPDLGGLTLRPAEEEPVADPWSADDWGEPPAIAARAPTAPTAPTAPPATTPANDPWAPTTPPAAAPANDPWAPAAPDATAMPNGTAGPPPSANRAPTPRRRINPALEGLPLLTDADGTALADDDRTPPAPGGSAGAPDRPARPAVPSKPRRSLLGVDQVMALADANAPRILPPDGKK